MYEWLNREYTHLIKNDHLYIKSTKMICQLVQYVSFILNSYNMHRYIFLQMTAPCKLT